MPTLTEINPSSIRHCERNAACYTERAGFTLNETQIGEYVVNRLINNPYKFSDQIILDRVLVPQSCQQEAFRDSYPGVQFDPVGISIRALNKLNLAKAS